MEKALNEKMQLLQTDGADILHMSGSGDAGITSKNMSWI